MSDGQNLKADIYLPNSWTTGPTVLIQTPYNKNLYHLGLPLGIGQAQPTMEYAIVILDWRGFWGSSAAAYQGAPNMGEDGYDAVEWIAAQSWSDGNIGTWGPSALGKVQFATARQHPPHLRCIVPVVAGSQTNYDEYYPGGSYRTEYLEQLAALGFALSTFIIANPYRSNLWTITENLNYYPDEIEIPSLMIAGWYDHNIDLMLPLFADLQTQSPLNVRDKHRLLVGPWVHGGHGTANPGSGTQGELSYPEAVGWNTSLTWQFFDYYLKGIENGMDETPAIQYFQMGDNDWLEADTWPVADVQNINLYLHEDGKLSSSLPASNNAALTFEYDPNNPSPTIGGPTLRNDLDQGPYDQGDEVESRDDILIFTTDVLSEDVVLKGQALVNLKISSDVADTDFAIRLCDVYPDGRSMLVADGIFRMRFRNGFTQANESFMTEGNVYDCTVELSNTALTFLAGHKIRIDVTSSNYPRFNRNMNTGGTMYPNNNGDILVNPLVAENTVHTSSINASHLVLPIVGSFPTVSVEEAPKTSRFSVYPNPASSILYVEGQLLTGTRIELFDIRGQLIKAEIVTQSQHRIALSDLPQGVYSIRLSNQDIVETKLIIIK